MGPPQPLRKRGRRREPVAPARLETLAAHALWIGLIVLATARMVLPFVPGMHVWSLNVQRFLAPAWTLAGAVALLACVPALARAANPALERIGRSLERNTGIVAAALIMAALVWTFPDRVEFTGDTILRNASVSGGDTSALGHAVQLLPLDALLHAWGPIWAKTWIEPALTGRLLGALDAALLALFAVLFARTIAMRGSLRLATVAAACLGAHLSVFTGEGKAFGETCVLLMALAWCVVRQARDPLDGWPVLGAGLVTGVGLLLHRSAIGFIPAFLLVLGFAWQAGGRPRWTLLVAVLIPAVALAVVSRTLVSGLFGFDVATNLSTAQVQASGGIVAAAFQPQRLRETLNLVLLLCPLAIPAALAAAASWHRIPWGREGWLISAVVVPFALMIPVFQPPKGVIRDWDVFAVAGIAVAIGAAWIVAAVLKRGAWLALPVMVATTVPALEWLAHYSDDDRGGQRAAALVHESPKRSLPDQYGIRRYLVLRNLWTKQYQAAAVEGESLAVIAPSPSVLVLWSVAEARAGHPERALYALDLAVARDSTSVSTWYMMATMAAMAGDTAQLVRAADRLARLSPETRSQLEASIPWLAGRR